MFVRRLFLTPRRRFAAALSLLSTMLCVLAACDEPCNEDLQHIAQCNRSFQGDVCAEKQTRCSTACFGRASCAELTAHEQDEPPPWLRQCLYKCLETASCEDDGHAIQMRWLCDGEQDCVDGSDERKCRYFSCGDGAPISSERQCDRWPDCRDRSDEGAECGDFLCGSDDQVVDDGAVCNGAPDCADGSDEAGCR